MKVFTFILSLYFLFIAVLPCDCLKHGSHENKLESTELCNHDADHNDNCSPFCVVCICNLPIYSQLTHLELPAIAQETDITKSVLVQKSTFYKTIYTDIWQPPKIVA
jgi:hypothetical protein